MLLTNNRFIHVTWVLLFTVIFSILVAWINSLGYPVYAIIIPLAIIGPILWKHPEIAAAILLGGFHFYPIFFELINAPTNSITTAMFFSFFSTALLIPIFYERLRSNQLKFDRLAVSATMCLYVWMVIRSLLSPTDGDRDQLFIGFLLMVMPFFAGQLVKRQQLTKIITAITWLGMINIIIALTRIPTLSQIYADYEGFGGRFSVSANMNPLHFSYILGIGAVSSLILAVSKRERSSRSHWLLVAITYVGFTLFALLAGQRGPFVAVIASTTVVVMQTSKRKRVNIVLIAIFVGILMPFVFSFIPSQIIESRYLIYFEQGDADLELLTSYRSTLWAQSFRAWLQQPLIGIGVFESRFTHNFLLETLTGLGVVGLLPLLVLLSRLYHYFLVLNRKFPYSLLSLALGGLLTYSIVMMSFSGQLRANSLFWFFAGMVCSQISWFSEGINS